MTLPQVVSRDEWLVARKELLAKEKEATRARDALNAERRRLPMVEIKKDYRFEGPGGEVGLMDLFEGRRQLIVDHFMWLFDTDTGCPSCSGRVEQYGNLAYLHERDTTMAVVSRAPLAKIEPFKAQKGWTFPWYSSYGSDFNYDFHVTLDEAVAPVEYNYRNKAEFEQAGFHDLKGELHGTSVFLRDGDRVLHTGESTGSGGSAGRPEHARSGGQLRSLLAVVVHSGRIRARRSGVSPELERERGVPDHSSRSREHGVDRPCTPAFDANATAI